MTAQEAIQQDLGQRIAFRERRPNVYQIIAPIFHEDGDMIDLFLETEGDSNGKTRITDAGLTLMRLSYSFDLDTPNKRKLFEKILTENRVGFERGEIFIDSAFNELGVNFLQLSQVIAKVSSLQLLRRQIVSSLFYEELGGFIRDQLSSFSPRALVSPLPNRPELEVDWVFEQVRRPLYLFGAKDSSKARLAAISCLEFQRGSLPFRSVIVHEDFEGLRKKDQSIITNASDKQFASLRAFLEDGRKFLEREAA